jgi:hypothetical protein
VIIDTAPGVSAESDAIGTPAFRRELPPSVDSWPTTIVDEIPTYRSSGATIDPVWIALGLVALWWVARK